ncbi:hypothetical protein AAG906_006830 [Vitis piasezkii]
MGADPSETLIDKGCQFMYASMYCHMEVMTHILRYLKQTLGKGLLFEKHDHYHVEAYTDVDWDGSLIEIHSTSGYYTLVVGNLVMWRCKKQEVSHSSAEAEFRAMTLDICELMWLNTLLKEIHEKMDEPMRLNYDNKAVIGIAHNPVQHDS